MEHIDNNGPMGARRRRAGLAGRPILAPRDAGIERVIHDIPANSLDELRNWTRALMHAVSVWEVEKCQSDGLARLQRGGRR